MDGLININGDNVQVLEILFLTTIITLLPSLLVMMTSFTRYVISLSFLRTAMGTQQTPPNLVLVGIALWGVGMGAQESILKAAVSSMVPKASRATGYCVFECAFGVFWFLGSWLLVVLYDVSIPAMIAVSVAAQLAAIPLYIASSRRIKANP